jgi:ParB family chromosome partitioning protein
MTNLLSTLDNAKQFLSQASSLAEVLDVRDKAEAVRIYAKAASQSLDLQNRAAEIKLRAERRAGELLKQMEKSKGGRPAEKTQETSDTMSPVLLEDIGITKKQSSRWQKESEVSEEKFESFVAECNEQQKEVTQSGLLSIAGAGHVSASTGENEWYTPERFIDASRRAMGSIDLDPASCETAQANVKAKLFYSMSDDGLAQDWAGNVWLNPPYSKDLCGRFIEKLRVEILKGNCAQACILVNNATETQWGQLLMGLSNAICFPLGRIQFLDKTGKKANSPLQGQMICYIGPAVWSFAESFQHIGVVVCGLHSNEGRE